MTDLIKIVSVLYVILSFFLSIVIFSKGEMNILLLVIIPAVIIIHSFLVMMIGLALCKILEDIKSPQSFKEMETSLRSF
jgi:hypothetical protein